MKARSIATLAVVAAVLSHGAQIHAAILEDFQFNDANNTSLASASNSASSHMWVEDTDHVATIQVLNGKLNIVKNNTDFVTEGLEIDDVTSGVLWMVAEFSDWTILGSAPDGNNVEEIRFGFMGTSDLIPPPSSTVLAEMMISRNFAANEFQISGTALGAAGTNIAGTAINLVQNSPFTMAMKVDQDANNYSIFYKDGANPFVLAGTGILEPSRDALIARMTVNNFIGDEAGEFVNLDRFYITDMNPIPEPATVLLLVLAAGALQLGRRRVL
jgi:hypothetical protein